jgi:hypothetical protein
VQREPGRFPRRPRPDADGDCFTGWPGILAGPVRRRFADGHGGLAGAHGHSAGDGESGHHGRLADDRAEFASGGA